MKPLQGPIAVINSESSYVAGRLDYQLSELIEFVWECEEAAAQADRIEAAIRWGCRESNTTKGALNP